MIDKKIEELKLMRKYVGYEGSLHKLEISKYTTEDLDSYVRMNDILETALIEDIILRDMGVEKCTY